jgi:hypothetical protein
MKGPTLKASRFAIRTSQRTDQKIAQELAMPTQTKLFLKIFPTLKKNKNTPPHCPTSKADNDSLVFLMLK